MMANSGVIKCYGVDTDFKPGALAVEQPGYRGNVYLAEGPGSAELTGWSPNHADVRVSGAREGDVLAYNMNFDPNWSANGEPAIAYHGVVAARLSAGTTQVTFHYAPRSLRYSIPLFLLTLGGMVWALRRERWRAKTEPALTVSGPDENSPRSSRRPDRSRSVAGEDRER
jgi:hypothetical protein